MGKTIADIPKYVVELPPPLPKEYKLTCTECGKQFVKPSRLKVHQATHLSEKTFKCSVEGCGSSYYRKNHLQRHEATRHSQVGGDYKCTVDGCIASFGTSSSLSFHNKRLHSEKKYPCAQCPEQYSKKFQLKEHEYCHKSGITSLFTCGVKGCNEEFQFHTLLKSHQKLHRKRKVSGEEQVVQKKNAYPCTDCDDVFDKWSSYLSHRKTSHRKGAKVECPNCNQMISRLHFRKHVKIHEDKKKSSLSCPYEDCSKAYQYSQNLAHHIKVFHEGHGFMCQICNRKLSTKQKLDLHIHVVHDNPPLPKLPKQEKFVRSEFEDMLSCEVDFEIIRRGPAKGVIYAKPDQVDESPTFPVSPVNSLPSNADNEYNKLCLDSGSELMSL